MLQKNEILKYIQEIKPELEKIGICRIGLFGSFAKGNATTNSDIDIVLESTDKFIELYDGVEAFNYFEELRQKIMNRFGREVDICDIASMPKEKQDKILSGVIYV